MSSKQTLVNMTSRYNLRSGSRSGGIPAVAAHARVAPVPTSLSGTDVTPKPKAPPKMPATGKARQKTTKRKRQVTPAAAKRKPEADLAERPSTSGLARVPLPPSWFNWRFGNYQPRIFFPDGSRRDPGDSTLRPFEVEEAPAPEEQQEMVEIVPTPLPKSKALPKKRMVTPESDGEDSDVEVLSIDEELPVVELITLDEDDSDEAPAPEAASPDAEPDDNQVTDGQRETGQSRQPPQVRSAMGQMSSRSVNRTQMPPKATHKSKGTKVPAPQKRKAPALLEGEDREMGRVLASRTVTKRQFLVKRTRYTWEPEENVGLELIREFDGRDDMGETTDSVDSNDLSVSSKRSN